MGHGAALIALLLVAGGRVARAQADDRADQERYALRAELGFEVDSNAHRTEIVAGAENPPLVASGVERLVVSGTISDVVADGQVVTVAATAAGKLFDASAAHDEDLAIAQSSLAWQKTLRSDAAFALAGAYYEAFQVPSATLEDASERRDFRSLAPNAQLSLAPAERVDLSFSAGGRQFVFKPDRDEDFWAPTAGVELRWARRPEIGADWEADAGAAYEHRTFGGPALTTSCPAGVPAGFACSGPDTRVDDFVTAHAGVTRVGDLLVGLEYTLQVNRSNSYGETVVRHFGTARVAASLPAGLSLAARAELSLAYYSQPQIVGQPGAGNSFSSVESLSDENRSSVRVDLSRDLGDRLRLLARYTFYANELGNVGPVSYRRQTLLISLSGALEK